MAKQKVDDFPEDDFDSEEEAFEEEEEEIKPQPKRPQPTRPIEVARTNKFAPQPKPQPENTYVAVSTPAVDGILNKKTNKIIGIGEAIAEMLSRQERIEESLG